MTKLQRMEAREEAAAAAVAAVAAVAVVKQQVKHHAEMDLRVGRRRRRFDDERRHAREHDHDHRQGHVVGQETTSTRVSVGWTCPETRCVTQVGVGSSIWTMVMRISIWWRVV
jgi:hypothetical protein